MNPSPEFQPISIQAAQGESARVTPYGAHVLSWESGGEERLFLSPKAEYRAGAAIRGGVPVIFPQFAGLGSLPKHGFARSLAWETARVEPDRVVFWLSESVESRKVWPFRFLAEYQVRIRPGRLEMRLDITNTDERAFTFTAALHTYLRVRDARQAQVHGLRDLRYRDSARGGVEAVDMEPQVTFPGEIDRLYLDAPAGLQLHDGQRRLEIITAGFPDAVVWNPGAEKCAALADMEPQGYLQFVCVEAAAAGSEVRLEAGERWQGGQTLIV